MTPEAKRYLDAGDLVPDYRVTDAMPEVVFIKTAAILDGKKVHSGSTIPLYTVALGAHTFTVNAAEHAGDRSI
ncbi:hypothetical protein [Paenibacillus sp. PL91]|uniref:hypothetical protein n=1 Tax=Paenibacillus sp. PL91 TaxID=2729538 RepID=UPI00145DF7B3|nr:hypothetical protein [Paenibacillus sp. PL91]MBC9204115.1 hypothetical protein [Paenibacillus sp. PL91]